MCVEWIRLLDLAMFATTFEICRGRLIDRRNCRRGTARQDDSLGRLPAGPEVSCPRPF